MSVTRTMGDQCDNETPRSNEQEPTADTCNNMDESQKQYVKQNKPGLKVFMCMVPLREVREESNLIARDRNQNNSCPWGY